MLKIHLIAAARPNFMKIAPLYHALAAQAWAEPVMVHTGQHYDLNMSDVFFQDLGLPEPHIHLGIGSGSHAEQTGSVMTAYEKVLMERRPELVVVVGDVNSTMACTLAAVKISYPIPHVSNTDTISENDTRYTGHGARQSKTLPISSQLNRVPQTADRIPIGQRPIVAHLEAGLRSFDRSMPEEINRLVTDSLADLLWTPSPDGDDNLRREGVLPEKIHRVGNIMIDSLELVRERIESETTFHELGLERNQYGVLTLHRPSNVDDPATLKKLCFQLIDMSERLPLLFPVHPRTRKNIAKSGLNGDLSKAKGLVQLEPLSYRKFMNLVFNCRLAVTDSGGIQEEASYLGIPCLTLRPNTERPVTVTHGTNRLCTVDDLEEKVDQILAGPDRIPCTIDLWDGRTADRVVNSIKSYFSI